VNDRPQPPADAYAIVADLLDDFYFAEAPPAKGTRLRIVGRDGIATFWDLEPGSAAALTRSLRRRRDVLAYSSTPYEHEPKSTEGLL
jgi:hypothetical protein